MAIKLIHMKGKINIYHQEGADCKNSTPSPNIIQLNAHRSPSQDFSLFSINGKGFCFPPSHELVSQTLKRFPHNKIK